MHTPRRRPLLTRPRDGVPGARWTRRQVTSVAAGAVTALLALVAMTVPVPYVVQQPGPSFDTLGTVDDIHLVSIDGAPTYPTDGELRLTTVSVAGGPDYPVNLSRLLQAWFHPDQVAVPREQYHPQDVSQDQIRERASQEMVSSQTSASVAALEELGIAVPTVLTVGYVDPHTSAQGVVAEGDVLTGITVRDRTTQIVDFATLADVLADVAPGTGITLTVLREGEPTDLTFPTGSRKERDAMAGMPVDPAAPDSSVLGVGLLPDAELPFDVEFRIDDVGGPSAGLMFALAAVDLLTPGEMTGGEQIAGTGTISLDGTVGAIGGVRQKIVGALDDGARWFLVPAANCAELAGNVPDGVREVPVEALADARDAVETIGGGDDAAIEELPRCESVVRGGG